MIDKGRHAIVGHGGRTAHIQEQHRPHGRGITGPLGRHRQGCAQVLLDRAVEGNDALALPGGTPHRCIPGRSEARIAVIAVKDQQLQGMCGQHVSPDPGHAHRDRTGMIEIELGHDLAVACHLDNIAGSFQTGLAAPDPVCTERPHRCVDEDRSRDRQHSCQRTARVKRRFSNQNVGPGGHPAVNRPHFLGGEPGGDGLCQFRFADRRHRAVLVARAEQMPGKMRRTGRFQRVDPGSRDTLNIHDQAQLPQGRGTGDIIVMIARDRSPQRHIGRAVLAQKQIGFRFRRLEIIGILGIDRGTAAASLQHPAGQDSRRRGITGHQPHRGSVDTGIVPAGLFKDIGIFQRGFCGLDGKAGGVGLERDRLEQASAEREAVFIVPGLDQAEALVFRFRPLECTRPDQAENCPMPEPEVVRRTSEGLQAQIIGPCQITLFKSLGNGLIHEPAGSRQLVMLGMTSIIGSIMTRVDCTPASWDARMNSANSYWARVEHLALSLKL